MGDLTTALMMLQVASMFGWLIDVVLRGINPRSVRASSTPPINLTGREYFSPAKKLTKIHNHQDTKPNPIVHNRTFSKNIVLYPVIIATAMIILGIFFRPLLVTAGFTAAAVISRMYQKHLRLQLGIDLAVFGTVLCAVLFGPLMGALVGLLAYPISIVYTHEEARYLPVALFGIAVVAVIAATANLSPAHIVLWGVGLTVLYDILTGSIYYYVYKAPLIGGIIFTVTHIWFNYIVFSCLGEWVLNILA
ncbi:MAG: hypothetical protein U9Q92_07255 [archaeon]|nr:hypothetical protein [archaeon]